ncbi:Flp family type IVb pilin [Pontivivens ytuae]|uniref:Pilus assembly protein n=1 Tax=Pontivivens ytuae TaxID=2789856 RepID=A0A7S9LUM1_9RHOB|nr:hypothetical protein [Pontivivens ytuae]QPH55300.1 hypothetical protein I0K15_06055 [Pontivivens ytuae]
MKQELSSFLRDTDGAVTVDWVVLAGAVVALAIGTVAIVEPALDESGQVVSDRIENTVDTMFGS